MQSSDNAEQQADEQAGLVDYSEADRVLYTFRTYPQPPNHRDLVEERSSGQFSDEQRKKAFRKLSKEEIRDKLEFFNNIPVIYNHKQNEKKGGVVVRKTQRSDGSLDLHARLFNDTPTGREIIWRVQTGKGGKGASLGHYRADDSTYDPIELSVCDIPERDGAGYIGKIPNMTNLGANGDRSTFRPVPFHTYLQIAKSKPKKPSKTVIPWDPSQQTVFASKGVQDSLPTTTQTVDPNWRTKRYITFSRRENMAMQPTIGQSGTPAASLPNPVGNGSTTNTGNVGGGMTHNPSGVPAGGIPYTPTVSSGVPSGGIPYTPSGTGAPLNGLPSAPMLPSGSAAALPNTPALGQPGAPLAQPVVPVQDPAANPLANASALETVQQQLSDFKEMFDVEDKNNDLIKELLSSVTDRKSQESMHKIMEASRKKLELINKSREVGTKLAEKLQVQDTQLRQSQEQLQDAAATRNQLTTGFVDNFKNLVLAIPGTTVEQRRKIDQTVAELMAAHSADPSNMPVYKMANALNTTLMSLGHLVKPQGIEQPVSSSPPVAQTPPQAPAGSLPQTPALQTPAPQAPPTQPAGARSYSEAEVNAMLKQREDSVLQNLQLQKQWELDNAQRAQMRKQFEDLQRTNIGQSRPLPLNTPPPTVSNPYTFPWGQSYTHNGSDVGSSATPSYASYVPPKPYSVLPTVNHEQEVFASADQTARGEKRHYSGVDSNPAATKVSAGGFAVPVWSASQMMNAGVTNKGTFNRSVSAMNAETETRP